MILRKARMTWWRWACLAFWFMNCEATIRIEETGRVYRSWPDQELGPKLADGAIYKAHLQQIQGNAHLCFAGLNWNVTVPDDGLPVALMVKKGVCSFETKAKLASRYIRPQGVVKFLIIDGYYHLGTAERNKNHAGHDSRESPITSPVLPEMLTYEEFKMWGMHDQESQSMTSDNESNLRDLELNLQSEDITVSVLHVSISTGYSLLEHILRQRPSITAAGGSLLELTGDSPSEKGDKTRMIWMLVLAVMGFSCCLCLMSVISSIMEAAAEPTYQPRVRPRRRRLTPWQVRKKFPLGIFQGGQINFLRDQQHDDHHGDEAEETEQEILPVSSIPTDSQNLLRPPLVLTEDTCIICLDDYNAGDKLRYLPCGHAFHSKCITKWLTERSATCPLCKIDLYESDNEDEDGDEEAPGNNLLSSSWNSVPPEAHAVEPDQIPVQQQQQEQQQETQGETLTSGHSSLGRWWQGARGALGRWGNWNSGRHNSTLSPGISLILSEPLLQEGNADEAPTINDSAAPLAHDETP